MATGESMDAYVLFIVWYPFLLRAILIGRPTVMVLRKLAPHRSWILSRLRDLPVKGLGILITNEVIAMLAPPLVVLSFRLLSDPVGWSTWEETPIGGASLLSAAALHLDRSGRGEDPPVEAPAPQCPETEHQAIGESHRNRIDRSPLATPVRS